MSAEVRMVVVWGHGVTGLWGSMAALWSRVRAPASYRLALDLSSTLMLQFLGPGITIMPTSWLP